MAENDIEYEYVDVDLCSKEDREEIRQNILGRGRRLSYPTTIIDDNVLITGYREDELRRVLEI